MSKYRCPRLTDGLFELGGSCLLRCPDGFFSEGGKCFSCDGPCPIGTHITLDWLKHVHHAPPPFSLPSPPPPHPNQHPAECDGLTLQESLNSITIERFSRDGSGGCNIITSGGIAIPDIDSDPDTT